jgi:hypothetical protein
VTEWTRKAMLFSFARLLVNGVDAYN